MDACRMGLYVHRTKHAEGGSGSRFAALHRHVVVVRRTVDGGGPPLRAGREAPRKLRRWRGRARRAAPSQEAQDEKLTGLYGPILR
jgi:hypothetical protein